MRALGVDPVHDTRATFRALVDAFARPGTVEPVPATPADHAVLATLVDHEVTLHTEDGALREALSNAGRLSPAPLADADVVHVRGSTGGRVEEATRGSLVEPSRGATVVYRVDGLAAVDGDADASGDGDGGDDDAAPDGTSTDGDGRAEGEELVRVTGPGVPGSRRFRVAGLPAVEVAAVASANAAFPRGVDVVLAAPDCVAALPRSVAPEVA